MAINDFSAAQMRAARGLLGWPIERLAAQARIEIEAIQLFESELCDLNDHDLSVVGGVLRRAGVIPIAAASAGEGVRLRYAAGRGECGSPEAMLPEWLPFGPDTDAAS